MSLENVANNNSVLVRSLQVQLHVALGIDHYRFALRSQHVGSVRQTSKIKLLEIHESLAGVFPDARPIALNTPRRESVELSWQWSDKFQTKTEAVAGADYCWHSRRTGSIEFNFKQVSRVEQNSSVQNHAALAHFGAAAGNNRGGKTLRGQDPDRHVDRHSVPAPRVWRIRHGTDHQSSAPPGSNYQGTAGGRDRKHDTVMNSRAMRPSKYRSETARHGIPNVG